MSNKPLKLKMLINTLYASVTCTALLAGSQAAMAGCSSASASSTTTATTATPTGTPVSVNNPQLAAPKVTTPVREDKLAGAGGPTFEQTLAAGRVRANFNHTKE